MTDGLPDRLRIHSPFRIHRKNGNSVSFTLQLGRSVQDSVMFDRRGDQMRIAGLILMHDPQQCQVVRFGSPAGKINLLGPEPIPAATSTRA